MNRALVSFIAALATFILWMSQMGNPHVAETAMGLILAGAVWIAVFIALGRRARKREQRRSMPPQAPGARREAPPTAEVKGIAKCPRCAQLATVPLGRLVMVKCPCCEHSYQYGP